MTQFRNRLLIFTNSHKSHKVWFMGYVDTMQTAAKSTEHVLGSSQHHGAVTMIAAQRSIHMQLVRCEF